MKKFHVAIMGTGTIARAMATAVNGLGEDYCLYAVASRGLEKAEQFAKEWNVEKAYGSYEEMVKDEKIDLIYVASPHSAHYENAKLCIENGRNVLCEKAFTANAEQAKELIQLSETKGVFITEAIWTRYEPSAQIITEILASGELGEIKSMEAEFSVPVQHIQRMYDPALCGGSLLDLGMYALTTADLYFGNKVVSVTSTCKKHETGVDGESEIRYVYEDGKEAVLRTSMYYGPKNEATITGTLGKITWNNLNNPSEVRIWDNAGNLVREVELPKQVNGYEYEVIASRKAIEEGKLECAEMPHSKTIEIMEVMDNFRKEWGVVYPYDGPDFLK